MCLNIKYMFLLSTDVFKQSSLSVMQLLFNVKSGIHAALEFRSYFLNEILTLCR